MSSAPGLADLGSLFVWGPWELGQVGISHHQLAFWALPGGGRGSVGKTAPSSPAASSVPNGTEPRSGPTASGGEGV